MATEKYFKITNKEENHNGFQYVDGLNILKGPFSETGSCVRGGLYFSNAKNILSFASYGVYLREITLPLDDPDFKMVEDSGNKWRANKIIFGKRYNLFDASTIAYLISVGANVELDNGNFIEYVVEKGHLEIVKYFSEISINLRKYNDNLLKLATREGHLEIVKFLIEKGADFKNIRTYDVRTSAQKGYLDMVKYLAKNGVDFKSDQEITLCLAAQRGHLEVIKFLVENGADPNSHNDLALSWARYCGHDEVVKFLEEQKILIKN